MDVALTCEADRAKLYEWQRLDDDIPPSATGVNTTTLTLVDLQSQDAGNYRCMATNESNNSIFFKLCYTVTIKRLFLHVML